MISIKHKYILLFLLVFSFVGNAQQFPQFSQYMYNTISINPAFAGSREIMVINLLNRNQWVGVSGAPVTQTFTAHTSIPFTKLGIGMSVVNDELGYERRTNIFADVSYRIDLDSYDEYKITFGLKVGTRKYGISDDLLNDPDYNSDPFLNTLDTKWRPNFGMGVYFRGESFYLGLSAPKLINNTNNNEFASIERMSYFFNGGYVWEVNKNLIFKPTFLFKLEEGAPVSFDLSTMFLVNDFLWLGVSYRFTESLGALINIKIYEGLSFGYSYEYITARLNPYTSGSHEFMLNYEFNFPKPRCKCKHLYN